MKKTLVIYMLLLAVSIFAAGCGNAGQGSVSPTTKETGVSEEVSTEASKSTVEGENSGENTPENNAVHEENASADREKTDFLTNACGIYRGSTEENADESEATMYEISCIDGRYYMEYISIYDFGGAEIELLSEEPEITPEGLKYDVMVYAFSGFSFAGEYWGAGTDSSITVLKDGGLLLSEEHPFYAPVDMPLQAVEKNSGNDTVVSSDITIHPVMNDRKANDTRPELIGSWRVSALKDDIENGSGNKTAMEVYAQFNQDGSVVIVDKTDGFVPDVYIGIYGFDGENSDNTGYIIAECLGHGTQPRGMWTLDIDEKTGAPIIMDDYDGEDPFERGVELIFTKTLPGEHEYDIQPGPGYRAKEVQEMWEDFIK